MKCFFFLFSSFALFVSNVTSLAIVVSPQAIAQSPTLVAYSRNDADSIDQLQFDLRFFQNDADAGLAAANLVLEKDTNFGSVNVAFPFAGTFTLKAVTGNTNIGTSNAIGIIPPISSASTAASTSAVIPVSTAASQPSTAIATPTDSTISTSSTAAVSTTTSSTSSSTTDASSTLTSTTSSAPSNTPPPSVARGIVHLNLAALVGGIIGGLALLAILIALFLFLHRRRSTIRKRITFHRDMMVQRRLSRAPTLPPLDPRASESFARDVEQGIPVDSETEEGTSTEALVTPRLLGTGHIVPSPKGPRPAAAKRIATITTLRTTGSPLSSPRLTAATMTSTSPAPTRTQRQQELFDRSAMLRRQMADLQLELDRLSLRSATTTVPMSMPMASPVVASPMTMTSSGMSAPNGRAAEIRAVLDDMQRQMVWLKEQEGSPWAMHMTDVLPPGHARYLRP